MEDYAARKGWSIDEAERWLAPNLNEAAQPTPTPAAATVPAGAVATAPVTDRVAVA